MADVADPMIGAARVQAPVRIADVGGWTDTWFARAGAVCHVGVGPGVTVEVTSASTPPGDRPIRIVAPDLAEDYLCGPSPRQGWAVPVPGRQPLLEQAIAAIVAEHPLTGALTVAIRSRVPPGASLGTSASVLVALVAALETVCGESPGNRIDFDSHDRARLAGRAHQIETELVGRQAGVQDHWAAAFGGTARLQIEPYPLVRHEFLDLGPATRAALGSRTLTVCFGAHDSSAVHAEVIAHLTSTDPATPAHRSQLEHLAELAVEAADALSRDEPEAWAGVLTEATETQARLHPALVGPTHRAAIDAAGRHGAIGWKVNGAGGDGGSLTIVFATPTATRKFADLVGREFEHATIPALAPSPGVTVEWIET